MELGQDALWVLPSIVSTRALRFGHVARFADPSYGGTFNGAYVLSSRMVNIAPQAVATAESTSLHAQQLNDESDNGWDNIPSRGGNRPKTLAEKPEWEC